MKSNIVNFITMQRQIFGICPHSDKFFRLSDCKVYRRLKPTHDWMDILEAENARLDSIEDRIDDKKSEMQEKAREKGRENANKQIKKVDKVFKPRRLNPDDAKVLFHPIDYIVFNGMKNNEIKNLLLLDRQTKLVDHRRLQGSIEKAIEHGNFEWITLRVEENGEINEE